VSFRWSCLYVVTLRIPNGTLIPCAGVVVNQSYIELWYGLPYVRIMYIRQVCVVCLSVSERGVFISAVQIGLLVRVSVDLSQVVHPSHTVDGRRSAENNLCVRSWLSVGISSLANILSQVLPSIDYFASGHGHATLRGLCDFMSTLFRLW